MRSDVMEMVKNFMETGNLTVTAYNDHQTVPYTNMFCKKNHHNVNIFDKMQDTMSDKRHQVSVISSDSKLNSFCANTLIIIGAVAEYGDVECDNLIIVNGDLIAANVKAQNVYIETESLSILNFTAKEGIVDISKGFTCCNSFHVSKHVSVRVGDNDSHWFINTDDNNIKRDLYVSWLELADQVKDLYRDFYDYKRIANTLSHIGKKEDSNEDMEDIAKSFSNKNKNTVADGSISSEEYNNLVNTVNQQSQDIHELGTIVNSLSTLLNNIKVNVPVDQVMSDNEWKDIKDNVSNSVLGNILNKRITKIPGWSIMDPNDSNKFVSKDKLITVAKTLVAMDPSIIEELRTASRK